MTKKLTIGISQIAIQLPDKRVSYQDMANWAKTDEQDLYKKIQVKQKPVFDTDEDLIHMSIASVKTLLSQASLNASMIDMLIFATATYDLPFQNPASQIAKAIDARHTYSFDINHGCNAGNLAIEIARKFMLQDDLSHVVIVCADALASVINYQDNLQKSVFSFADGVGAILLTKDHESKNQIMGYAGFSQNQHARFIQKDKQVGQLKLLDAGAHQRKTLKEDYIKYTINIIDTLMIKNRINISDIPHIFINQGHPWLIDVLNNHYELNSTQIHRTHEYYGHMGNIDTWFGLQARLEAKEIAPRDHCLLLASGYGFSWSGHLIQH